MLLCVSSCRQQPNPQTLLHQTSLWISLLLSWARFHRVFTLNADSPPERQPEVCFNRRINRRLGREFVRYLMGEMVRAGQLTRPRRVSPRARVADWIVNARSSSADSCSSAEAGQGAAELGDAVLAQAGGMGSDHLRLGELTRLFPSPPSSDADAHLDHSSDLIPFRCRARVRPTRS